VGVMALTLRSKDMVNRMMRSQHYGEGQVRALECRTRKERLKIAIKASCRPQDVDFLCTLVDEI